METKSISMIKILMVLMNTEWAQVNILNRLQMNFFQKKNKSDYLNNILTH